MPLHNAETTSGVLRLAQSAARLANRVRPRSPLLVDALIEDARSSTRLEDFGDADFLAPLAQLVSSLENEARLTPFGREIARTRLRVHLVNRLRLQADRSNDPAIREQQIIRPLFIVGPPRTGTSILFRLLARDERALAPMAWQLQTPSPPPPRRIRRTSPLYLRAWADELFLRFSLPRLRAIRDTRADLPEECCVLQAAAFVSILFAIAFDVPSYQGLLLEADYSSSYVWHKAALQQLQLGAGGHGAWVLKSPGHLFSLDTLFAHYPDACIVQTHRDPLEFVPSLASLSAVLRSLSCEPGDPATLAESTASFWATALERALHSRSVRSDLENRFVDIRHDEIAADPIAVVERIYAHFDRELSPRSRNAMTRYLAANPRDRHGRHEYSPEAFGLDRRVEARRFARYRTALHFGADPDLGR